MLREKLAVSGLISLAMITMITFNSSLGLAKGATPLEPATEQALRETQQGLTNPAERAKMIQGDAKAEAYDAKVKSMLGDQSEGAYQISSGLMETIVSQTGGDQEKMQEIMSKLLANPQALEQYLTPAQREKIRTMASEMEKKKGAAPASGSGY